MAAQPAISSLLLFENSLARIVQEADHLICVYWHAGLREEAGAQLVFQQVRTAQQQTGCTKLLMNEQLAGIFTEAAKAWLVENWLPHLTRSGGFRHVACVLPTDVFARLSNVPVQVQAKSLHLPFQPFSSEAAARRWLHQQP
ncbi:hypothetical protein [uncultured Hymenobacter sp.]|uniref:hypothetical protein n=1 Tax=uncultured Hymenobacter sp. TaxID=170016 RepID=UPI0035CA7193